ncbi:MAG: ATP-binding cassette domain-containing protein, partial [Clostridia bacterium]
MILPLALREVTYEAGGKAILAPLSLVLDSGPSTIILGANGAGKSVLMRLMHGLIAPASGRVEW